MSDEKIELMSKKRMEEIARLAMASDYGADGRAHVGELLAALEAAQAPDAIVKANAQRDLALDALVKAEKERDVADALAKEAGRQLGEVGAERLKAESERDVEIESHAAARAQLEALALDALAHLSGAGICTPLEGYLQAPHCLGANIDALAKERDVAMEARDEARRREEKASKRAQKMVERAQEWRNVWIQTAEQLGIQTGPETSGPDLTEAIVERVRKAEKAREVAVWRSDRAHDCGQEDVCATLPGCGRHWAQRNRELLTERDCARAALAKLVEMYESEYDPSGDAWTRPAWVTANLPGSEGPVVTPAEVEARKERDSAIAASAESARKYAEAVEKLRAARESLDRRDQRLADARARVAELEGAVAAARDDALAAAARAMCWRCARGEPVEWVERRSSGWSHPGEDAPACAAGAIQDLRKLCAAPPEQAPRTDDGARAEVERLQMLILDIRGLCTVLGGPLVIPRPERALATIRELTYRALPSSESTLCDARPADVGAAPPASTGTAAETRCRCGLVVGCSAPELHAEGCEELERLRAEHARRDAAGTAPEEPIPGEHYWLTPTEMRARYPISSLAEALKVTVCLWCGVVRRADGNNKPCPGKVEIRLREEPNATPCVEAAEAMARYQAKADKEWDSLKRQGDAAIEEARLLAQAGNPLCAREGCGHPLSVHQQGSDSELPPGCWRMVCGEDGDETYCPCPGFIAPGEVKP